MSVLTDGFIGHLQLACAETGCKIFIQIQRLVIGYMLTKCYLELHAEVTVTHHIKTVTHCNQTVNICMYNPSQPYVHTTQSSATLNTN